MSKGLMKLAVIEHKDERVLTTAQIAEAYGVDVQKIYQNYSNNKTRYKSGKHYYKVEGEELKLLKTYIENFEVKGRHLILWTEKGALLHAKSLNTDEAWEVYEHLVDTYFKAREMFQVPKSLPEALRLAAELAEKIEADKPKVLFADKCLKSGDSILIRELAKIACDSGLDIGEKRLFAKLREWGLLMPNNEPYQVYVGRGCFEVIQRFYDNGYETRLTSTTKVLPKGQQYIIDRLAKAN